LKESLELRGYIAAAGPGNVPDYKRPVWSCGHEHATRGEAIACLAAQRAQQQQPAQADDPGDSNGR
jgi:hypothetical protein